MALFTDIELDHNIIEVITVYNVEMDEYKYNKAMENTSELSNLNFHFYKIMST